MSLFHSVVSAFLHIGKVQQHEKPKVKSLSLTKYHAMKTYLGSGGIAPRILDIGTSWR
jgi:hypothetical protein